jgi:3-oxoadipate enol-lactonase
MTPCVLNTPTAHTGSVYSVSSNREILHTMPIARIGDLNIHYQVAGQGAPLLLIMGYRGSSYMWGEALLTTLSHHFRVITFDNRGTGKSDKPNTVYTIPMMADDAAGLLQHLGIGRTHVFGVSMGGMIAQELVLRYPKRVERLILGCTTCGGPQAIVAPLAVLEKLLATPDVPREEAIRRLWPVMFSPTFVRQQPDVLDRLTERALAYPTPPHSAMRQVMAALRFNTYGRLGQIVAPTLVVTGRDDIVVPPDNSRLLAHRIPDATLEIIPDVGHGFLWEQPDYLVDLLVAFCNGGERMNLMTQRKTRLT